MTTQQKKMTLGNESQESKSADSGSWGSCSRTKNNRVDVKAWAGTWQDLKSGSSFHLNVYTAIFNPTA